MEALEGIEPTLNQFCRLTPMPLLGKVPLKLERGRYIPHWWRVLESNQPKSEYESLAKPLCELAMTLQQAR